MGPQMLLRFLEGAVRMVAGKVVVVGLPLMPGLFVRRGASGHCLLAREKLLALWLRKWCLLL